MKISKYNFFFDVEDKEYYVYNTLSNALLEIDEESYSLLKKTTVSDEFSKSDFDEELFDALVNNGIVTESDDDDYLKYKSIIVRQREQRGGMHLTLAPTMDCCFRCHYCFEKYKEPNYMTPEVMDSIIKYITSQKELESITLTWFGGEPLMALPQMEQFYDKLKTVWDKPVTSNIITTGFHINEEAIRVLKKIGVSSAQITVDGIRDTHNNIKFTEGCDDAFSKVWSNIKLLNDLAPEIDITIRVNLTKDNSHEYILLLKLFLDSFKNCKNISIAPAFVLDRGTSNCDGCDIQSTLFNHKERSEFILNLAYQGINSPFIRYPERFFNECAIRNDVAISFDPEGYAYKCWEVIGNKEYSIGKLNEEGLLTDINVKILNRQLYGADTIDDPACSKCKYLPICNGGCPIQRIQNKYEGGKNNVCTYHKGYMVDFLKLHIARKKGEKNNPE